MKITIDIDDQFYDEISNLVKWVNMDELIGNRRKASNYTIEDFIKGVLISEMEILNNLLSPVSQNVLESSNLKNNFKEIAKRKNIRQVDICNKLGIHKSNLSAVFNNKDQPRLETFFKIWAILECPPIHKCIYFED